MPVPVPVPVFVLPDTPREEDETERRSRKRKRRDEEEEDEPRRSGYSRKPQGMSGGLIAILACVAALVIVGAVVGGYYVFRDSPKETAKNDPPPTLPKPPAPKQPALTPEQMIKKVKTSTVYVRTFLRGGAFGTGTGFFAGKPGFVVTNAHVIGYGPRDINIPVRIEVVVDSGERNERIAVADVYGVDVDADLALLRVEGTGFPPPLALGKSEELTETQEVIVFGYPFGEQLGKNVSVNRTTVSSLRKANGSVDVVQLAGGLNPGNSGGPVANAKGEVVGVSVAKLSKAETIAFAIPAEKANRFVDDQHVRGGQFSLGLLAGSIPTELEGTYLMIGIEGRGQKLTEADLRKVDKDERKFVIIGNQFIAWNKGKSEPSTIKLDDSQKPAHFDIVSTKDGVPEVNYGIYKFEDEILMICMTEKNDPADRPKEFKSDAKSLVLTLRKQTGK
jgi:uncharacterized protein (TIGR03067 family)